MSQKSPIPRSNYFGLSASTGKQVNAGLFQPVRIRMPGFFKDSLTMSDEKPLLQPVRLKDLVGLESLYDSPLNKRKSCSTSYLYNSKQKSAPQRQSQNFLKTKSCERIEAKNANRQSMVSGRVRRQLYNTGESSERENDTDGVKPLKKSAKLPTKQIQNNRKSSKDLPLRVTETKPRPSIGAPKNLPSKYNIKRKKIETQNSQSSKDSDESVDDSFNQSKKSKRQSTLPERREKSRKLSTVPWRSSIAELKKKEENKDDDTFVRPSVIIGPRGKRSNTTKGHDKIKVAKLNETESEKTLNRFSLFKFQESLEENIRTTEQNLANMKEMLLTVKHLLNLTTTTETTTQTDFIEKKCYKVKDDVIEWARTQANTPRSPNDFMAGIRNLETPPDMVNARLSTITEVSCEADESKSEKLNLGMRKSSVSKTPIKSDDAAMKTDSARRRSARLAAINGGTPKKQGAQNDSFTQLENELRVVHDFPKENVPIVANTKIDIKPTLEETLKWNPTIERPLQEYLALKTSSSFLVTPDLKRFQSVIDTSATPALSRKSMTLSKKVFTELCALYAESPK